MDRPDFKTYLAHDYRETYELIKRSLIKGDLIQADETQMKLSKASNAYVWVFANMNTVFYLYKPTREADFLKEFLQGFKGILISDFYTGYESLECLQQKCLVHLIRDLNADLFKNQLNDEFKNMVSNFGKLLRSIVETIDKYGLRKRHLNKHKKQVDLFYKKIIDVDYDTSLGLKYKKRFLKYRNTLFTFLNYDNIPWNNNNAEYAIKSFARIRERGNSRFTVKSINDYLILLSIHQTCKYRGIDFLDFLRSKKKNINSFY